MATESPDADSVRRNRLVLIAIGVIAVAIGVILCFVLRSPPQMGTNEKVFNTVDALYTAVRNEDAKRLEECEQRLKGYRDAGLLPPDAAEALDAIIATARRGRWRSAAESLYHFMNVQRRDGVVVNTAREKTPTALKPKSK